MTSPIMNSRLRTRSKTSVLGPEDIKQTEYLDTTVNVERCKRSSTLGSKTEANTDCTRRRGGQEPFPFPSIVAVEVKRSRWEMDVLRAVPWSGEPT